MSSCHSLESSDDVFRLPKVPQEREYSSTSSWTGRRIVVIKEKYPHVHNKPTADEELLQRLLRRSLLNLPENPFQNTS